MRARRQLACCVHASMRRGVQQSNGDYRGIAAQGLFCFVGPTLFSMSKSKENRCLPQHMHTAIPNPPCADRPGSVRTRGGKWLISSSGAPSRAPASHRGLRKARDCAAHRCELGVQSLAKRHWVAWSTPPPPAARLAQSGCSVDGGVQSAIEPADHQPRTPVASPALVRIMRASCPSLCTRTHHFARVTVLRLKC